MDYYLNVLNLENFINLFRHCLLLTSSTVASAETVTPTTGATESIQQEFPLQFDELTTITTPYDLALYDFQRSESPNEVIVKVVDINSGRIVSTYGEKLVTQKKPAGVSIMASGT